MEAWLEIRQNLRESKPCVTVLSRVMAPQLPTYAHYQSTGPTAKKKEQPCVIARKCVLL